VWAAVAVGVLVAAYAVLGFKVLPGVVRDQAIAYVKTTYHRDLSVGRVTINPFLLQVELDDVALPDADGRPMVGFRRLFVDFETSSLWHRAFVFKEITLEDPRIRAVRRADGGFNLADLAPSKPAEPAPPPKEPAALPAVWIESLAVTGGAVDYADLARRVPLERRFAPVSFGLKDFHTTAEGGDFRLDARSEANEHFDWKGRFAVAPQITAQGEFAIEKLRAAGVAELAGDAMPFGLSSGTIDVAGNYQVKAGDVLEARVQLPLITLADLGLRARGADADWISVPRLTLTGLELALPAQTVALASVNVTGLKAQAWLAPDGSVNLSRLFAPPPAGTAPAPAPAPAKAASAAPPARPWQVSVGAVEVDDAAVHFEDRARAPVKAFDVTPIRVRVRDVSLDLAKPLPVEVSARINDQAGLSVAGTLTPAPLAASLDVALEDARLRIVQPYVLPVADLAIESGTVTVKGHLDLRPPKSRPSELSFAGDVVLSEFRSKDNALHEDFVNFGRVQVEKLRYEMAPDSLKIDRVLVREPYARVVISREQILNVSAVLDPAGTAKALAGRRAKAEREAHETPAEKAAREKQEQAEADAAEAAAKKKSRAAAAARPASGKRAAPPPEKLPIRIREVRVEGGRMNFSDLSIDPNFAADIRQLRGTVTGLSSAPTSKAKLKLDGNVGEFSPVAIEGEVQPFMFDRFTDIGLKFSNISLPLFNPYSGRFAGYAIAKGKLDTDIHYLIQDRKLDAKHHIRIDQLEWGAETATKGAATLPVKFATVLLRDRHGVIDLTLPVSGTLDDPKFRIGPIVWQVIKNILVKAVTAPFALLGSLFGGSEDAQFVDFAPGQAALDAAAAERLAGLAKALVEKPGLALDIPIGAAPELDGPALVESRFRALRAAALAEKLRRKPGDATPLPDFDGLEPKVRIDVLTALVKSLTGAAPKVPDAPAPPDGTPRDQARALRETHALAFLEQAARGATHLGDGDLDQLAQSRAEAVQRAILSGGQLEPSRVFLVKNGSVSAKDGHVRYELKLR
jgi:uncharacterized protein involved in outer membrane biogenesis